MKIMKKKWLSRTLAAALASIMALGLLSGCGQKEQEKESTSTQTQVSVEKETSVEQTSEVAEDLEITYPLDTDETVSIFVQYGIPVADIYVSADDSPWHSGLEKMTGIDIDWQYPTKGTEASTALNLVWQEKKLPVIVYGNKATVTETATWYEDGLIQDLTELLPKYAPDYWAFINSPEMEEEKKNLTTADGRFLAIYSFTESEYNAVYLGPVIRQDWLDECNLEAPRTLEEWENVLVTFKEKYGATLGFPFGRFNTAGGFSSGTGAMAVFGSRFYLDDNNKVQYGNVGPEYKEMLEIFYRWYDMGLIDPDFATADDTTIRAKALNGEIGVSITAMSQLTNWGVDAEAQNTGANWVGFPYPATEVGAPITYHYCKRSLAGNYGATITTTSTEEETIAALKLLNYGYTEEGKMYHNFGEEGVTYTVDADGNVAWTDLITSDAGGVDAAIKKYSGTHTGVLASVQLEQFVKLKNSEAAGAAVYKWVENSVAKKYTLPTLAMTEEEKNTYTDLYTPIKTYVEEMVLKFATGKESLDKYEEYEAELYKMGLEKVLEIQQAAADRYFN